MVSGLRRALAAVRLRTQRVSFGFRLALFYGALFTIYGVHLPYLPVWLDARGLTAGEIAIVTAAPLFLRVLITPVVAMAADRTGRHRRLINVLAWLALALAAALAGMGRFWPILLLAVPFAISLSTIMPLTETLAVAGVRAHGLDYGRMRLWGSLTFVIAGFVGGSLIDHVGADAVIGCITAGAAGTALIAGLLPERRVAASVSSSAGGAPPGPRASPHDPGGRSSRATVLRLVGSPVFLAFLLAVGSAQGAHGMFYSFGALAWHSQGIATTWTGALWAIAIAGEVALFAYSGAVVRRVGPATLMLAATGGSVVRWSLMSLAPPLALLVVLQTLHTLTYAASHLAAMHFISRAVPDEAQGTAQALYATVASGLMMGAATLAAGSLYGRIGVTAYLAMAAMAAVGLVAALFVRARWTGDALWSDEAGSSLSAGKTLAP